MSTNKNDIIATSEKDGYVITQYMAQVIRRGATTPDCMVTRIRYSVKAPDGKFIPRIRSRFGVAKWIESHKNISC